MIATDDAAYKETMSSRSKLGRSVTWITSSPNESSYYDILRCVKRLYGSFRCTVSASDTVHLSHDIFPNLNRFKQECKSTNPKDIRDDEQVPRKHDNMEPQTIAKELMNSTLDASSEPTEPGTM